MSDTNCQMNQRGQSLIQTMIAIGIGAIVMAGFTSMMLNQQRETKALGEILASQDLQRSLTQVLAAGTVCSFIFNDPANTSGLNHPFPATFTVPATYPLLGAFTLTKIPNTAITTATMAAKTGSPASNYSNSLQVESMQIDITGAGSVSQFSANLVVNFNPPSLLPSSPVRQIRSLSLPIIIQTTISGSLATVTACGISSVDGTPPGGVVFFNLASCPSGWSLADGTSGSPDLRGQFIRGLDTSGLIDAGRTLNSFQLDQFQDHAHRPFSNVATPIQNYEMAYSSSTGLFAPVNGPSVFVNNYGSTSTPISGNHGLETRPKNVALLPCIKN